MILDEPTNHLDIDSREALVQSLAEYSGAVILISHDRHLVEASVDRLWLVADGTVAVRRRHDDYRLVLEQRGGSGRTVAPRHLQSDKPQDKRRGRGEAARDRAAPQAREGDREVDRTRQAEIRDRPRCQPCRSRRSTTGRIAPTALAKARADAVKARCGGRRMARATAAAEQATAS
jgi:ABC-type multidrug transport system ATPase subunit